MISKYDFLIQSFETIVNPLDHAKFKQPSFENRTRPIPTHMEIEELETLESIQQCQDILNLPINIKDNECCEYEEEKKDISSVKEFYQEFIHKTKEQCEEEANFPQKSKGWLKSRHYCITASQFGTAIGDSPYQSPEELVHEKIFKKFEGNTATEYGNEHEDHARQVFCDWYKKQLELNKCTEITFLEMNLIKFWQCPWVGVSPDGIVRYKNASEKICWELIEYKCPARYKVSQENPYEKFPYGVPPQYMAQIQGIMGYCNLFSEEMKFECAWFIVWLPTKTYIKKVCYNKNYFDNLHTKLKDWYFEKYLPVCFRKYMEKFPKTIQL